MLENTVIRFTSNNSVTVETEDSNGMKGLKTVDFDELIEVLISAKNASDKKEVIRFTSEVLPHNELTGVRTVKVRQSEIGETVVVLHVKPHRARINYYDDIYENVGIPALLVAITHMNKQVRKVNILCVKDDNITDDTKLYKYPFSNVSGANGKVCFGGNTLLDIPFNELIDLHSVPFMFLSMPNNNDQYSGANASGLEYRPLLELLNGEDFDNNFLVKVGYNEHLTLGKWMDII